MYIRRAGAHIKREGSLSEEVIMSVGEIWREHIKRNGVHIIKNAH
jgi:hypothetical protein